MKYDYLIVGAGLYGAVFAHEMTKCRKRCLVIDKREHIAGNRAGSGSISTAPTSSIPATGKSGTISTNSLNSTNILIPPWLSMGTSSITSPLI